MSREKDYTPRGQRFFTVPDQGVTVAVVDREIDVAKTRFSVVYGDEQFAKPGTLPDLTALDFAVDMLKRRNPNLVEPAMFLGAWEIEREAVSMLAELLHHPNYQKVNYNPQQDPVLGWFTDSGTSSFMQASWSLRNRFFRDLEASKDPNFDRTKLRGTLREEGLWGLVAKGLVDPAKPPVILAPVDMHFAGDKSIDVLGLGAKNIVRYGLTPEMKTDYDQLETTVKELAAQKRDIMFAVACAGSVDSGRVEDVRELYRTLQRAGVNTPIIVDAAQQYMMTALLPDKYAEWDFRVEGVEAMVVDPHKTDATPYPGSVVLFRNKSIAWDTQSTSGYLHSDDRLDFDMKRIWQLMPQFPTSRSPLGAIATWAHLILQGREKLRHKYQQIHDLTQQLADYVRGSPHFTLISEPQTGIVALHTKDLDDIKAHAIYKAFEEDNERPRFYISFADNLRVRTMDEFRRYTILKDADMGHKVHGFGGLYIQIMHHATPDLIETLIDRLDLAGYKVMRTKTA